ncbi:hypothetical protein IVB30_19855 [Bradyrhizobium sp. 200]|uniref:hypothetical protein n=1 Tax=Bradyrhizobium sp. 200 TaxID=2782665 RepID=UPI00205877E3|nr:hypothetical protein IVB30_19855 [Bradyrhizobium sp. 200]
MVRKPTELLFFVGGALDKVPSETWQQYGPLFRKYSTDTITPELLAALAQIESTGKPPAPLGPKMVRGNREQFAGEPDRPHAMVFLSKTLKKLGDTVAT